MDEKALLDGARYLNYVFLGKNKNGDLEVDIIGEIQKFELLNIIEFDSQRKRMSIIIKDLQTNEILLFCKGADSVLRNLTSQNMNYFEKNKEQIFELSSKGLRNLNVAYRYLDQNKYNEWNLLYKVIFPNLYFYLINLKLKGSIMF